MRTKNSYFLSVIGFATLAGLLRGGLNANIHELLKGQLFRRFELSLDALSLLLSVISVLSLAAMIGVFVTGYWWANHADIPNAYGRFAVSLFAAAVAGYGLGFLPLSFLFSDQSILAILAFFLTSALSALSIPTIGLAGGAIAQYHSVMKKSY